MVKPRVEEISDLHTVKEESDDDMLQEDETIVRNKQEARDFVFEEVCLQNVIEEWIFDHAIKVDKVKATL